MKLKSANLLALRLVLALGGLAVTMTGVNVGLGGITTLGFQGPTGFIAVVDPHAFDVQDSHVRFLGGLWLGVGLLLIAGAIFTRQLRVAICTVLGLVAVGALARLSNPTMIADPAILPSFIAEIAVMPLVALWTWRATRPA